MTNPTQFVWTIPAQNTDNSPIVPGELTGFQIGIRPASGTVGTYPTTVLVNNSTASSEAFSLIGTTLAPGNYAAAVMALSTINGNSAWSSEATFTIAAPVLPPKAPTGFTVS